VVRRVQGASLATKRALPAEVQDTGKKWSQAALSWKLVLSRKGFPLRTAATIRYPVEMIT